MATVGNVTSMMILSKDQLNNEHEATITNRRLSVNPAATYEQVDALARALNALTYNNYYDTILTTRVSVTEVLAG